MNNRHNDKPWLVYAEYKSQLVVMADQGHSGKKRKKRGSKKAVAEENTQRDKLNQFIENPDFFYKEKNATYSAWLTWTNHNYLFLSAEIRKNETHIFFKASEHDEVVDDAVLLELKINDQVNIQQRNPQLLWQSSDLDDIANDFYALYPANHSTQKKSQVFTTNEFLKEAKKYDQNNLTTRLQKTLASDSVFWLNWNEKILKIQVKIAPYTKSYVFSEQELFDQFYPEEGLSKSLRHYRIQVYETTKQKHNPEKLILELMTTVDALVAEVFKLHAGFTLGGNQILAILQNLLNLIRPQHLYLQDVSHVTVVQPDVKKMKAKSIIVPLRLSNSLMSASTWSWYEKYLHVTPVSAHEWKSGWNKNVTLSQSSRTFYKAAKQLRELPFTKLLKYWKEHTDWLLAIVEKYYPSKDRNILTAQDIFTAIFNKDHQKTEEGFANLQKLETLLKWQTHALEIDILDKAEVPGLEMKEVNITNKTLTSKKIKSNQDIQDRVNCIMRTRFASVTDPCRFFNNATVEKNEQKKRPIESQTKNFSKRALEETEGQAAVKALKRQDYQEAAMLYELAVLEQQTAAMMYEVNMLEQEAATPAASLSWPCPMPMPPLIDIARFQENALLPPVESEQRYTVEQLSAEDTETHSSRFTMRR